MNQSHTNVLHHLLGALSVAATVLGLLAPIVKVVPGPAGLIAGAVLGGLSWTVNALGQAFLAPAPASSSPAIAIKVLLPLLAVLPFLHGCAALSSPAGQTVELAAIDSAVAVLESKGIPAADINAVAQLVQAGDATASGILAGLITKANPNVTEAQAVLSSAIARVIADTGSPAPG